MKGADHDAVPSGANPPVVHVSVASPAEPPITIILDSQNRVVRDRAND